MQSKDRNWTGVPRRRNLSPSVERGRRQRPAQTDGHDLSLLHARELAFRMSRQMETGETKIFFAEPHAHMASPRPAFSACSARDVQRGLSFRTTASTSACISANAEAALRCSDFLTAYVVEIAIVPSFRRLRRFYDDATPREPPTTQLSAMALSLARPPAEPPTEEQHDRIASLTAAWLQYGGFAYPI